SGYVARYAPFIRDKSPTKCDAQLPESNFKTRSKAYEFDPIKLNNISVVTLSVWFLAGCSTSTS
ncbi:MAG: DUF6783 domain-containing protein, partial [Clostridiales bacterium]|nr:hypothetical protein [Clostridiales bacterium]MDU3244019.1 DUF6783 domain-containing protein [Clostridiales bacterium]